MRLTDGQTAFTSLDRVCTACSMVKIQVSLMIFHKQHHQPATTLRWSSVCAQAVQWYTARNCILWLHFTQRMCRCIFNHFYVIGPKSYRIWRNKLKTTQTTRPLRRSRSFKVTDFSTNQKPICDLLLVINTNLPPILHRFLVMVKFSLARGEYLTLTLLLGVIPCQYHHKWYVVKNYILWPISLLQKMSVYLQPLLRNPPRNLPNSMKLSSR